MGEGELLSVEQESRRRVMRQLRQPTGLALAVGGVAGNRKAKVTKVNADLVGAAGVQVRFHQGGGVESFENAVFGVGGAAGGVVVNGHAFALGGMSGDGRADVARVVRDQAAHEGQINFLNGAGGELRRERGMCRVVFGDDEATAGFLVKPMDNAGSRHAADAAEFASAMMQQRIDQGVIFVACRRMHDESGRFVQDKQRRVFVENIEGDVLGLRGGGFGFGKFKANHFAGARGVRGFDGLGIDGDVALFDKALNRTAREGGELSS